MSNLVKCPIKDFTAVVKPELSGGDGEVKETFHAILPQLPYPPLTNVTCYKFLDLRLNNLKNLTKEKKTYLWLPKGKIVTEYTFFAY